MKTFFIQDRCFFMSEKNKFRFQTWKSYVSNYYYNFLFETDEFSKDRVKLRDQLEQQCADAEQQAINFK